MYARVNVSYPLSLWASGVQAKAEATRKLILSSPPQELKKADEEFQSLKIVEKMYSQWVATEMKDDRLLSKLKQIPTDVTVESLVDFMNQHLDFAPYEPEAVRFVHSSPQKPSLAKPLSAEKRKAVEAAIAKAKAGGKFFINEMPIRGNPCWICDVCACEARAFVPCIC